MIFPGEYRANITKYSIDVEGNTVIAIGIINWNIDIIIRRCYNQKNKYVMR